MTNIGPTPPGLQNFPRRKFWVHPPSLTVILLSIDLRVAFLQVNNIFILLADPIPLNLISSSPISSFRDLSSSNTATFPAPTEHTNPVLKAMRELTNFSSETMLLEPLDMLNVLRLPPRSLTPAAIMESGDQSSNDSWLKQIVLISDASYLAKKPT